MLRIKTQQCLLYISLLQYTTDNQQKDSKKTTDNKELKQPNTKEELKKSSNHHLPKICRLELGFSTPRMFHRFHHRRCSQYGLWTTISKQNFPCIWCRTHWPNNLGTCLMLHILHGCACKSTVKENISKQDLEPEFWIWIFNTLASNIFHIQFLTCSARNRKNLERILKSLVSIIKHNVVHSFLIAVIVVRDPLVGDHTRVIPGSSRPETNYTLTSMDFTVIWWVIEYYCCRVNLV